MGDIKLKMPTIFVCQKITVSSFCSSFVVGVNGIKWISGKEKIRMI